MKILLPTDISDITLKTYLKYNSLTEKYNNKELTEQQYEYKVLELFSGIPYNKIDKVAHKDLILVLDKIAKALKTDVPFTQRFELGGVEYGFIPNLDEMSTGEYLDLNKYFANENDLPKLMAVLFRPIVKSTTFNDYEIKPYEGSSKYEKVMLKAPMNVVNGATGFFLNLSKELEIYILKYSKAEQQKA